MNHRKDRTPVPVTFVGNDKNIETEKAHKDRVQKRFAFYCLATLGVGFVLGSLLGLITGPVDSTTVYVAEETSGPSKQLLSFAQVSLVESAKNHLNKPRSTLTAPVGGSAASIVPRMTALRASYAFETARPRNRPSPVVQKAVVRVPSGNPARAAQNPWLDFSVPFAAGKGLSS